MKEKGKRITPESVFYFLSLTGIIGFLVYAFHAGRNAWIWMIQENNPAIRGVDFFTHMLFSRDPAAVYEVTSDVAGCFPPLIYFMYHFFFRLGYHPDVPYYQGWKAVSTDEGYFFVYVIYSLLVILLLCAAVQEIGRRKNRSKRGRNQKRRQKSRCLIRNLRGTGTGHFPVRRTASGEESGLRSLSETGRSKRSG